MGKLEFYSLKLYKFYLSSFAMNSQKTKTTLAIVAIVSALTLVTAATLATVSTQAFASSEENEKQGGPKAQKNYGQCKQEFNDNVCKKFQTGGGN